MQTPLLTINETATILKVHKNTILRLITANKIAAIKVGDQWRITEQALTDYLDSRTVKVVKRKTATI